MHLQFDKLTLSYRQPPMENHAVSMGKGSQCFFWTEGLILLDGTDNLLRLLDNANPDARLKFTQRSLSPEIQKLYPELFAKWPINRIFEYCELWRSKQHAFIHLIIKARGERESRKEKDSSTTFGGIPLDERQIAIRLAATYKAVNVRELPSLINRAAKQNDVRFFIRLGRALQSRKRVAEVDWDRVDPIPRFLVDNWCGGIHYNSGLPALCFFVDQALADFCSAALGRKDGNPSCASIRQWRKRLGLKQARAPKIKETILINNEILFTEGGPLLRYGA